MHLVLNKVKMMKELIHPQDIYDLNKNKTENPFSAPMHKKPNINFDKAQADQTLAGRNLTLSKHTTGGPPLTRFSLPRIPLQQFLAYVRASGGF